MEPTLAQIKEYVREKGIDLFGILGGRNESNTSSLAFGDHQTEVYFEYYLEHSIEICEWMKNNQRTEEVIADFR